MGMFDNHYFGGGFTGVGIRQNSLNCIFKIGTFYLFCCFILKVVIF